MRQSYKVRAGELVEVRNKAEVLQTLDKRGRLDGLPFMPEMFQYCGRRLRVFKRAHKTCDPPNGMAGRRMLNAVHLEDIRCDGQSHGGCQAGCLIFWKDLWLKRIHPGSGASVNPNYSEMHRVYRPGCTEKDVEADAVTPGEAGNAQDLLYSCQSTKLSEATLPLHWWDLRQYLEDYTSGNVPIHRIVGAIAYSIIHFVAESGMGFGSPLRGIYSLCQKAQGGSPYPWRIGEVPKGSPTPSAKLDLQPGEWVRVKSYEQILKTLNQNMRNKGMYFDAESVPYCGGKYRVLRRVERIIDEKTGKMLHFNNDALILDKVVCQSHYAKFRRFCPRSIFPYWREVWLERIDSHPPKESRDGSLQTDRAGH